MREYLIEQLAHRRGPGGRRGGAARPRGSLGALRRGRLPRAARPALAAGAQAPAGRARGRPRGHVRGHARRRPAGAPPLPLVRGQRRALRAAGGGRPRRARDQDDRVPHLGRLWPGAVADRGGRARQAGGVPGGAQGALRRAPQHRLGARAGRGGRSRGARAARPEDPRQGAARGAPRGRRRAPLRAHRDRQLPRARRRASTRTSACSPATRRSPPTWPSSSTRSPARRARPATARRSWRPTTCATGSSRRSGRRSRRASRGRRRASS